VVTYWDERDLYQRALDGIDQWASDDWRDPDQQTKVRTILRGLRSHGLLDGVALVAEMKKRGHSGQALKLLREHIEETYREPLSD
jgi:hypothetical protein